MSEVEGNVEVEEVEGQPVVVVGVEGYLVVVEGHQVVAGVEVVRGEEVAVDRSSRLHPLRISSHDLLIHPQVHSFFIDITICCQSGRPLKCFFHTCWALIYPPVSTVTRYGHVPEKGMYYFVRHPPCLPPPHHYRVVFHFCVFVYTASK